MKLNVKRKKNVEAVGKTVTPGIKTLTPKQIKETNSLIAVSVQNRQFETDDKS